MAYCKCNFTQMSYQKLILLPDITWHDMIWHDMIWFDMIWYDLTWYDLTWYDMIWHGMIWHDMIWHDMTWHDKTYMQYFSQAPSLPWPSTSPRLVASESLKFKPLKWAYARQGIRTMKCTGLHLLLIFPSHPVQWPPSWRRVLPDQRPCVWNQGK